jgi:geranyl-CoA carboxylase alpha subunit
MEVRLYAEDPAQGFLPQTGDVLRWEPAPGARIDHGLLEGQRITPFYDPMLGKIIAHGATREEARRKLLRAVEDCVLLGVSTNQRLLADLLKHPQFIAGDFSTGFIAEHFSEIPQTQATNDELALAAALFYQRSASDHAKPLSGWRNNASVPWTWQLAEQDESRGVSLSVLADNCLQVEIDRHAVEIRDLTTDGRWATAVVNGIRRRIAYHLQGTRLWLPGVCITDQTQAVATRQAEAGNGTVKAPMDGAIVEVRVSEGDSVSKGQLLLVLEAMKMEHPLKAGMSGVVKRIQAVAGDQVRNRQILLEIE